MGFHTTPVGVPHAVAGMPGHGIATTVGLMVKVCATVSSLYSVDLWLPLSDTHHGEGVPGGEGAGIDPTRTHGLNRFESKH
jgi:hypothetical protein